jgi:hypothetical protein
MVRIIFDVYEEAIINLDQRCKLAFISTGSRVKPTVATVGLNDEVW